MKFNRFFGKYKFNFTNNPKKLQFSAFFSRFRKKSREKTATTPDGKAEGRLAEKGNAVSAVIIAKSATHEKVKKHNFSTIRAPKPQKNSKTQERSEVAKSHAFESKEWQISKRLSLK